MHLFGRPNSLVLVFNNQKNGFQSQNPQFPSIHTHPPSRFLHCLTLYSTALQSSVLPSLLSDGCKWVMRGWGVPSGSIAKYTLECVFTPPSNLSTTPALWRGDKVQIRFYSVLFPKLLRHSLSEEKYSIRWCKDFLCLFFLRVSHVAILIAGVPRL